MPGFTEAPGNALNLGCGRTIRPAAIAGWGSLRRREAGGCGYSLPCPAGDYNESMKRIRVAVPNDDDCMRCERILDDAAVPFDLNQQQDTGTVLIYLEDESVQKALDLLEQAGFKADVAPE